MAKRTEIIETTNDDQALLNELLGDLSGTGTAPDEIIESVGAEAIEPANNGVILEAATVTADSTLPLTEVTVLEAGSTSAGTVVEDIDPAALQRDLEIQEAQHAAYAESASSAQPIHPDDTPLTEALADGTAPKKEKGKKKASESERRGPPLTKSQKVAAKLGEKAKDYLILEMADAELDEAALQAKQEQVLAEIDGLAKKVSEKAGQLFGWLTKGGAMNEVMARAFRVLITQGELTSGVKGNLQTDLLAKPYSPGTAASQSNQVFMLFPMLRITVKERGRMIANPESVILAKVKAELGL